MGLEHARDEDFPVADAVLAGRAERSQDAEPVGVAAGEQSGPRGRTDRLGDVEVRQTHSLTSQPIQMGSANRLVAVTAQVAVTQVVGVDDHKVRPISGIGTHPGSKAQSEKGHQKQSHDAPPTGSVTPVADSA